MNLLTLQAKVIKRKKIFLNWNVEGVSRADPKTLRKNSSDSSLFN